VTGRGSERPDEPHDDVAALLGRITARERPSDAAEAAAFTALRAQWRRHTASRRWKRALGFAGAAAASLAVAVFGYVGLQPSAPPASAALATIDLIEGANVTWRDDRSQARPLGARRELFEGERLATGPDSRVALRWHSGGSLRLDASSRLELVSAGAVRLTAGRLYFDSAAPNTHAAAPPALAVQTPAGEVVHVGTQFMVTVADDEVVLSVREGQVKVTGDGFELVVVEDEELGLRSDGTRDVAPIDGHDPRWAWAADIAPQLELDGRTAQEILLWAARETGRSVVYESPQAELRARAVLRGIDRRSPASALALLPHMTDLEYDLRDDAVVVSAP
jgi:hypothetical protein